MDIDTLETISRTTKGSFFRADDRAQLDTIYHRLDEIEPEKTKTISYRPRYPLFHWPVGTVLVTFLGYHLIMAIATRGYRLIGYRASKDLSSSVGS